MAGLKESEGVPRNAPTGSARNAALTRDAPPGNKSTAIPFSSASTPAAGSLTSADSGMVRVVSPDGMGVACRNVSERTRPVGREKMTVVTFGGGVPSMRSATGPSGPVNPGREMLATAPGASVAAANENVRCRAETSPATVFEKRARGRRVSSPTDSLAERGAGCTGPLEPLNAMVRSVVFAVSPRGGRVRLALCGITSVTAPPAATSNPEVNTSELSPPSTVQLPPSSDTPEKLPEKPESASVMLSPAAMAMLAEKVRCRATASPGATGSGTGSDVLTDVLKREKRSDDSMKRPTGGKRSTGLDGTRLTTRDEIRSPASPRGSPAKGRRSPTPEGMSTVVFWRAAIGRTAKRESSERSASHATEVTAASVATHCAVDLRDWGSRLGVGGWGLGVGGVGLGVWGVGLGVEGLDFFRGVRV